MPTPSPFADSPEFLRLARGEEDADLSRVALEIARDAYPDLDPLPYLARIDLLADRVRDRCPEGARPRHILGQINWVLFVEEGFEGNVDDYDDPRNSYLNQVLDRKTGIPISLSALYLAVADHLGLAMRGVNLPGHFVIRTQDGAEPIFVDPFHGGTLLDRDGCRALVREATGRDDVALPDALLGPCATSAIVARMLRNLRAIYLRGLLFPEALPVLRRLVILGKNDPEERRDLGVAAVHAGRPGEAIPHLSAYLSAHPRADDAAEIEALARVARADVSSRN